MSTEERAARLQREFEARGFTVRVVKHGMFGEYETDEQGRFHVTLAGDEATFDRLFAGGNVNVTVDEAMAVAQRGVLAVSRLSGVAHSFPLVESSDVAHPRGKRVVPRSVTGARDMERDVPAAAKTMVSVQRRRRMRAR